MVQKKSFRVNKPANTTMATAISAPFEPTSNVQDKTFNPYFAQGDQMLKSVRSLQSDSVSADADATSERIVNSINSMTRQVRNRTTRAPAQIPAAEFSRVSVAKEAEEKQEEEAIYLKLLEQIDYLMVKVN